MTEPMPPIEQRTPTEQHQKLGSDNITAERVYLPRITIKYCTQCKWMLRSAYVRPFLNNKCAMKCRY